jgi:hypothetical protein
MSSINHVLLVMFNEWRSDGQGTNRGYSESEDVCLRTCSGVVWRDWPSFGFMY